MLPECRVGWRWTQTLTFGNFLFVATCDEGGGLFAERATRGPGDSGYH